MKLVLFRNWIDRHLVWKWTSLLIPIVLTSINLDFYAPSVIAKFRIDSH
jgi:hypothetical protein